MQPHQVTTPLISSPPFRPYGPAASRDSHACLPRDSCSTGRSTHLPKQGASGSSDKKSGKNGEREEPWKALDHLCEGGTLVIPSLDRLGRSSQDLIAIVSGLRKRGVGFTSLHEALDTATPCGRLVFHVFAAPAEFIRELIVQGSNEGLDAARGRGARLVHPPAMTEEQVRHARGLLARPENTVTSIAKSSTSPATPSTTTCPNSRLVALAPAEATSTPELPKPTRSED
ncbi:recombinase family protein [Streptomyces clavifer]|uniref:recombinase family protein n=1 Tax=Streptomyces clavifer TaxID=68188 RepID=UPI003658A742